jgi:hypothetical protein
VFNQHVGQVPYKGQILNQLTNWWFEQTADIVPNHVIDVPDPNITVALTANPLPIAVVVRGFVSGITPASLGGSMKTRAHDLWIVPGWPAKIRTSTHCTANYLAEHTSSRSPTAK